MESNLLESNERTLDIFDSVHSGLAGCLALVHADIRQMSEHREQLSRQLELEVLDDEQLEAGCHDEMSQVDEYTKQTDLNSYSDQEEDLKRERDVKRATGATARRLESKAPTNLSIDLSNLKLLDKQLADSFSQALSRYDREDFEPFAGSQANRASSQKPSLFQVLLGRGGSGGGATTKSQSTNSEKRGAKPQKDLEEDNSYRSRSIIDDINRQTRLALQYSKQLESHLMKVEDLRAKYEMHLKMGLAVRSVSRAYLSNSCRTSSSSLGLNNQQLHHQNSNQRLMSSLVLGGQSIYNGNGSLHKSVSYSSLKRGGRTSSTTPTTTTSAAAAAASSATRANQQHQMFKSPLNHSQQHLHSNSMGESKTTIRQFIENIERLEAEFESYMGSFLLNIEDIQGFARICQGDVFKIEIRYGQTQKFKTRITVLKDNRQKCDQKQTVFKARIADVLAIKAYECKGLGKRLLLGHKLCETRDLFTARSQMMTISLNQTGSIKLNLMITWNPLHLAPRTSSSALDIAHFSLPPTPISSSTLSSLSSARSAQSVSSCDTKFNNSINSSLQRNQRNERVKSAIIGRPQQEQLPSTIELLQPPPPPPPPPFRLGQPSPQLSSGSNSFSSNSINRRPRPPPRGECCADCDLQAHAFVYGRHHIPEPDYLTTSESKF